MWKLIALTSLVLLLALGSAADAKCRMCIESISAQAAEGSGWGRSISLRLAVRAGEGVAIPEKASAVVMQVDGDRSKCLTVSLPRVEGTSNGLVTYAGTFQGYGQTTHSGRLDIGGDVYDFTVPLSGQPGTVQFVAFAPGTVPAVQVQIPRAVVPQAAVAPAAPPTAAVANAATGVRDERAPGLSIPDQQGLLLGIGVVAFVAGSVLLERRRAHARARDPLEA